MRSILVSLIQGEWTWESEHIDHRRESLRGHLRGAVEPYDVILVEVQPPVRRLEEALKTTRESFELYRSRLSPGGIVVIRLPDPHNRQTLLRILRTARSVFSHAGFYTLEGSRLIAASEAPLSTSSTSIEIPLEVQLDELFIARHLAETPWTDAEGIKEELAGVSIETDDRPLNAYPLADILAGRLRQGVGINPTEAVGPEGAGG